MPYPRLRLGSSALLLAAFFAVSNLAAAEESASPAEPRVISGSGSTRSGLFTASADGAVFEFPSHARIVVAPNSTVRISPASQGLGLVPGPLTTTWSFALHEGRADIEMPSEGKTAVLVGYGKLSVIVTKGHVVCLAHHNEFSVANIEGEVRTLLADHWQTIAVGSIATLSQDNPNATPKPGPQVPKLAAGPRVFVTPSDTAELRGFHWARVPGAARYELRVRRVADGKVVDQHGAVQPELDEGLHPVAPGKYGLSLRSIDARGLESRWSPEAELRVVGVLIPPGGYSDEHAVFVVPGQSVRFTNTAGLEMTYVGTGHYSTAARAATLYRDAASVIGFRAPGSPDTATVRLEPRDIYADVRLSPKRAAWPRDPVTIDIELKSKAGRDIPAFIRAVPQVTLGLEPLDVTFERNGNVLHAVIPPSEKAGPWVLRVDVADQFGTRLGRDFLEVASLSRPGDPPKAEPVEKPVRGTNASTNGVASTQ